MAIKSANPKAHPLKISINFSFSKLAGKIHGIIIDTVKREKEGVVKVSKKTIKDKDLLALSDGTMNKRRAGISDYEKRGHKPRKTSDDTPLHYTGSLYKSIKVSDKGIDMLDYGMLHNQGIGEPEREFLAKPGSPKMNPHEKIVTKKLHQDVLKNLMRTFRMK